MRILFSSSSLSDPPIFPAETQKLMAVPVYPIGNQGQRYGPTKAGLGVCENKTGRRHMKRTRNEAQGLFQALDIAARNKQ